MTSPPAAGDCRAIASGARLSRVIDRFATIALVGIAALTLILIGWVPPVWKSVLVACLCAAGSLTFGRIIHRAPPSRLSLPWLIVCAALICAVWGLAAAHTFRAVFDPRPDTPQRTMARQVTTVSVFVYVTTLAFMILRGEFRGYLAWQRRRNRR